MIKCDICNNKWDEQFLTTYENMNETDNTRQFNIIRVCEECDTECIATDDGYTIEYDGITWKQ